MMANRERTLDVAIIGAGAAGVGMSYTVQQLGIERYLTFERETVGASFKKWTKGMRFITPSFTSNNFGSPDLNAITYHTSPAYTLKAEHPTGEQYAQYLLGVVKGYDLHVQEQIEVSAIERNENGFLIETSMGKVSSRFLIWAAGEFQYPNLTPFAGAELALHNSQVDDWRLLEGEDFVIIGGYESGIDAAFHLTRAGKSVTVLDARPTWEERDSDPSIALSTYTLERLKKARSTGKLNLLSNTKVKQIVQENGNFVIETSRDGRDADFQTSTRPILATGFEGSLKIVKEFFEFDDNGQILLTENDESTRTPDLFLVGSQVRHDKVIFCFIYKFRQRFPIVAKTIGERMGLDVSILEEYRRRGMYLDDLSCCRDQCEC
jgi:putative flavoprotein involved in K+ transport